MLTCGKIRVSFLQKCGIHRVKHNYLSVHYFTFVLNTKKALYQSAVSKRRDHLKDVWLGSKPNKSG